MNRSKYTVAVLCIALSSCSFQSPQLAVLQEVFSNEESYLDEVSWEAEWNEKKYTLYAVDALGETVFAYDRKIRIHFNGWNITEVVGILPNDDASRVETISENNLAYYLNDRLFAEHQCEAWRDLVPDQDNSRYVQECVGREKYINQIDVNSDGRITRLEFTIHPQYPPIQLKPR